MKKTALKILTLFIAATMIFGVAACTNNDGETQDLKNRINRLELDLADAKNQIGIKGEDGKDGVDGKDGADGDAGLNTYEIFKKHYPEYSGSETQWLDDYLNGLLAFPVGLRFILTDDGTGYEVSKGTAKINGTVVIPSTFNGLPITSVRNNAFSATYLESITIPATVTSVDYSAFNNCSSLKNVIFEEYSQLNLIGDSVFNNCPSLENITVPASITNIGRSAFRRCTGLKNVMFESGSRLDVIGRGAFELCESLESITIPSSVAGIVAEVFLDCNALKRIFYGGADITQWNEIDINMTGNEALEGVTIYFYSETEITGGTHWRYVGGIPTVWE